MQAVLKRQAGWLKVFWVRLCLPSEVYVCSAALSEMPAYSLGEAFIWIRFPLFHGQLFLAATDKRLLYAMMGMTMLGMIIMTGILTAEVLIVGQQGGSLSWPYGDLVPGNYLAKAGLPAFCVLVALAVSDNRQLSLLALVLSLFTLAVSAATGERINFIIRVCSAALAALVWKPKLGRYSPFAMKVLVILLLFLMVDNSISRFVDRFISELPTQSNSPYLRAWNGGIDAFQSSPLLGIGPDGYRHLCADISAGQLNVDCHTHPHNFYVQIAAETGVVGLIAGLVMVGSL